MDSRKLVLIVLGVLVLSILTINTHAAFGEEATSCGYVNYKTPTDPSSTGIRGCLNFTMYPGEVLSRSWTIINENNYSMNFYIDAPYYGNADTVPNITYTVPCMAGQYYNVTSWNTTLQRNITVAIQKTCSISANTNTTINVIVVLSKNVPINETWGDCTYCLTTIYAQHTFNNTFSGATIGAGTAKRVLISVVPKPKPTTTIIPPSGSDSLQQSTNPSKLPTTDNKSIIFSSVLSVGFICAIACIVLYVDSSNKIRRWEKQRVDIIKKSAREMR